MGEPRIVAVRVSWFMVALLAVAACSRDGLGGPDAGVFDAAAWDAGGPDLAPTDGATPDIAAPGGGLFPDAPDGKQFMWASLQERFHRGDGSACTGRVTVAVGGRSVCYVASDDQLRCAGSIYTHDYGAAFAPIGQMSVDQILLTGTSNSNVGDAIFIHRVDGTVWSMGDGNRWGAFTDGTTLPNASFVKWASPRSVARLGQLSDPLCILDDIGGIYCAGYMIGGTPKRQGNADGHSSFWITTFGELRVDDPLVFRVSNSSPCRIEADGLHCSAPMASMLVGAAGKVVDGTIVQPRGGLGMEPPLVCWLETSGRVQCGVSGISAERFAAAAPVLALAGNFYTDSLCAVSSDGSLWCMGSNRNGELGSGEKIALKTETRVAPPGSVKIDCR